MYSFNVPATTLYDSIFFSAYFSNYMFALFLLKLGTRLLEELKNPVLLA